MNLIYFSNSQNSKLEKAIHNYNNYLEKNKGRCVQVKRVKTLEDLLNKADVISIHIPLNEKTRHLIGKEHLSMMKDDAILINTSRGPIIDEEALAIHCRASTTFMAGLDVFENEPLMYNGIVDLDNVVVAPHIASATKWTREGMAKLAALNLKGVLENYTCSKSDDISLFLGQNPPNLIPSLINPKVLDYE